MGLESSRMEGEQVIQTCREMVAFLRERSRELRDYALNHPFSNAEEEICFFKYYKPALTGRLLYYYRVYQIESGCSCCPEIARMHYRKAMKEYQRKLERYLPFYQYYRSPLLFSPCQKGVESGERQFYAGGGFGDVNRL